METAQTTKTVPTPLGRVFSVWSAMMGIQAWTQLLPTWEEGNWSRTVWLLPVNLTGQQQERRGEAIAPFNPPLQIKISKLPFFGLRIKHCCKGDLHSLVPSTKSLLTCQKLRLDWPSSAHLPCLIYINKRKEWKIVFYTSGLHASVQICSFPSVGI